jgi:uridine kinase
MKTAEPIPLVAIVGGSGSGKSWLADRLQMLLPEKAGRLSLDDFYRDQSHLPPGRREKVNFDHPSAIDWPCVEEVLQSCRRGVAVNRPRYDFTTHTRFPESSVRQPLPLILMDGLWLLHRPAVRQLFDLSIYIDCPDGIRARRRLSRDVAERGRTHAAVRRQLKTTVLPMHRRYVQPQIRWAKLVLNQPYREADLEQLADLFLALLNARSLSSAGMGETFRAQLRSLLGLPKL